MKLETIYKTKNCPSRSTAYWCDGKRCAKFVSCIMDEIDALHAIGGITMEEANVLDKELIKTVRNDHEDST